VGGEGKTLVSCNLALSLANRSANKVLLIEGDLRKPAVCHTFGIPQQPGVGEWWCGQERRRRPRPGSSARTCHPRAILPHLRHFENSNLWLLAAGTVTHSMPILQSPRLAELMAQLAGWFDWIVVDTPPLLPTADSNLWARVVDGTLLVVREGTVPRKALQQAIESLDNPKLIGAVINDASEAGHEYGDYYGPAARGALNAREEKA
jgi:Mrp family chromosome partitioning ATPase